MNKQQVLMVALLIRLLFWTDRSVFAQSKPKVWIYTDMSDKNIKGQEKEGSANDPDDISAMAGYLLLANEFDTKAIIVSSTHRKEHKTSPNQADWANQFFGNAYRNDVKNLNLKIKGYPADITFIQSCIKESAEHFKSTERYASLVNYSTIKSLFDLAKKEKDIIYVLIWGSTTEPAILVKHCIETGNENVLKKIRFIAHWTSSYLHQGSMEHPENVANCREDAAACAFLKENALAGKVKYYECGAIGQHGIVSGSQKGMEYFNQFKTSEIGRIFAEGKFAHNSVDHSDAATYWTLLGNWGVSLNDIKSNGTNTPEIEKANEEKFVAWSHRIHNELLRRSQMAADSQKGGWRSLFDGKTFDGWTKYLGVPHQSNQGIDLPKDDNGKYTKAFGINNDPLGVFKIVNEDGKPAIHVTGQVFGTLTFKEDFENYHIKLEFKWGQKKWQPRQNMVRDAGLLYHGFGQQGSTERNWHPAQECQIQEGDIGDYWPTGDVTIDIPAVKTDTSDWWFYSPNAPLRTQVFSKKMSERRIITNLEKEKPHGEWNTVEVICWGDSSLHIVNGKVVMRLFNSRKVENKQRIPLKKGTIALQSEGAELFYRNVQVRPIKSIPKEFLSQNTFQYQNPIKSGIDPNGLRDCQVLRDGDWWYMTGTSYPHWARQETDGNLNKGVVLYRSKNLTNWEFVKWVVERGDSAKWYYRRFWAPEIQKIKGKYYATFNCNNDKTGHIGQWFGYAVADKIEGPYSIVTKEKPLAAGNDFTLFEDTDGKVWAFWNRGREFGIGFAQIDLENGKFLTEPQSAIQPAKVDYEYDAKGEVVKVPGYDGRPIPKVKKYYDWDAIGIEGAYIIKRQNTYYLFYSSWTRGYEIGYATAPSITGPWTKATNNPFYGAMSKQACEKNGFVWSGNAENPFNQVGHNEVFIGPDGRFWLSCHGIMQPKGGKDEQPFLVIDPIDFDEKGNILKKEPTYKPVDILMK